MLQFPKSCVIYIRKGDSNARNQNVKVVFPNGITKSYTYEVIKNNKIKKRVNEEMKGIVYDLPSDKIRRAKIKAEKRGKEIGKELEIISLVSENLLSEEIGAQRLGITVEELRERMNKEELDVM